MRFQSPRSWVGHIRSSNRVVVARFKLSRTFSRFGIRPRDSPQWFSVCVITGFPLHKRLLELGTVRYVLCQIVQKNDSFLEENRKVVLKLIARFSKCDFWNLWKIWDRNRCSKKLVENCFVEKKSKKFSGKKSRWKKSRTFFLILREHFSWF